MVAIGPLTCVQVPVPVTGVFPARVVDVAAQSDWSVPAAAIVGVAVTVTCTLLLLGVQAPLEIVHLKV